MINNMLNNIVCENCGKSALEMNKEATLDFYNYTNILDMENITTIINDVLSEYLIFTCKFCGESFKYTYKDIEFMVRRDLSKLLIAMLTRGDIAKKGVSARNSNFYIYCGKCTGFNGKGACPPTLYNDCLLKRLPYV